MAADTTKFTPTLADLHGTQLANLLAFLYLVVLGCSIAPWVGHASVDEGDGTRGESAFPDRLSYTAYALIYSYILVWKMNASLGRSDGDVGIVLS